MLRLLTTVGRIELRMGFVLLPVLTLTRTVRCSILPPSASSATSLAASPPGPPPGRLGELPNRNSFAGWPSMHVLGAHVEWDVQVKGEPAPSGYLLDIKAIDRAVRESVLPLATRAYFDPSWHRLPDRLVLDSWHAASEHFAQHHPGIALAMLRQRFTPTYSIEAFAPHPVAAPKKPPMPTLLLRQRFDFAAAHRLHVHTLSDRENQALFGKCNNPNGHGHNYQFEPCVSLASSDSGVAHPQLHELETLVERELLDRFDHKHLNLDTTEFDQARGGLNPSVENIAKVFFEVLAPALAKAHPGARLQSMCVWETDRTCATYDAT